MSRIYSNGGRPSLGLLATDMFDDSEMLTTEKDSVWIEFSNNWPKQNSVASYISLSTSELQVRALLQCFLASYTGI